MGTSVSVRSPAASRPWAMARASISTAAPPETVLADMIVAAGSADDWLFLMQSPGLQVYADRLAEAWADMPSQIYTHGVRDAIAGMISDTRTDGLAAGGGGLAIGVAERALARALVQRLSDAGSDVEGAVETWRINRGTDSGDLVADFLAETMRQLACHFFARDAAGMTGGAAVPDARALRQLTRQIGDIAAAAAEPARQMLRAQGPQAWAEAVQLAFQSGGSRGQPHRSVPDGG